VPAAHTAALALSLALAPLTPLAASADDADPAAAVEQVAAAVASSGGVFGLTPVGAGLAALPIISYSLFFVYREKINPRATVSARRRRSAPCRAALHGFMFEQRLHAHPPQIVDLLFGVAATVILGNIFSILVFKTRIY
jgi:hypothetical protein